MQVTVKYFAILAEQAGYAQEIVQLEPCSCAGLYAKLQSRHQFSLPLAKLRVAVNEEFTSMDYLLQDNDQVAFIPPVSGG